MRLAQINVTPQPYEGILPLEVGFKKGSLFPNLYSKYKYEIETLPHSDGRDNIIYILSFYGFAITDLTEFLDTHPLEQKALIELKRIQGEYAKAKQFYEQRYGPLSSCGDNQQDYAYVKGPWPWEGK